MPRAGTTLVEQILGRHPTAFGAGEQPFWGNVLAALLSGAEAAVKDPAGIAGLAGEYREILRRLSVDAEKVIDKMPGNFMVLGLIHAALPDARIIHVERDPRDTCLSIHFQNFEGQHPYAHDLDDLTHYYREYLRVMAYWRDVLPSGLLLEIRYEDIVRDQEAAARRMVEFAGLRWDSCCLDYRRNAGPVLTASNWQVRQPVTAAAVGRWRHYEDFLGPLRDLAGR
jgi:hypothetical protein